LPEVLQAFEQAGIDNPLNEHNTPRTSARSIEVAPQGGSSSAFGRLL
jgi:hypothetical protein